mmetsp:Transcript_8193/g.24378  ORF Transcript_8193/g.24378 Transcript_8193/m.24378 type:complete len:1049 (-) Transcript_8193:313-3459(-)
MDMAPGHLWRELVSRLGAVGGTTIITEASRVENRARSLTGANLMQEVAVTSAAIRQVETCQPGRSHGGTRCSAGDITAVAAAIAHKWEGADGQSSLLEGRTLVAILLEPGLEYVVAVLACLAVGAAWMPLHTSWPPQRIQAILARYRIAAIIVPSTHLSPAGRHNPFALKEVLPAGCTHIEIRLKPASTIAAATLTTAAAATATEVRPSGAPSQDRDGDGGDSIVRGGSGCGGAHTRTCYVICTSGSTGEPAAVCGSETGLMHRCGWGAVAWPWRSDDVAAVRTSPCFVDAAAELIAPLLAGVPVVLFCRNVQSDPDRFVRMLNENKVTRLTVTPAMLTPPMVNALGTVRGASLRLIISSGMPMAYSLAAALLLAAPRARLVNMYGSTEVGADATYLELTPASPAADVSSQSESTGTREDLGERQQRQSCPVATCNIVTTAPTTAAAAIPAPAEHVAAGVPVSLTTVIIMRTSTPAAASDSRAWPWKVTDRGCEGEVWVAGPGLATGYLGEPMLTSQRFWDVPLAMLAPYLPANASYDMPSQPPSSDGSGRGSKHEQVRPTRGVLAPGSAVQLLPGDQIGGATAMDMGQQHPSTQGFPEPTPVHTPPPPAAPALLLGPGAADWLRSNSYLAPANNIRWDCEVEIGHQGEQPAVGATPGAPVAEEPIAMVRFCRTGDLGLVDEATGVLRIIGRADLQVKIHGERVDLREVERVAASCPGVAAAACRAWPTHSGLRLAVYLQPAEQDPEHTPSQTNWAGNAETDWAKHAELLRKTVRGRCHGALPSAAVPAVVVVLQGGLPRSAAGKLARGALPEPDWLGDPGRSQKQLKAQYGGAKTLEVGSGGGGWEARVMVAFAEALDAPGLEPTSDFWFSGGDSLAAAAIANSLHIDPSVLAMHSTARTLAQHLAAAAASEKLPGRSTPHVAPTAAPTTTDAAASGRPAHPVTATAAGLSMLLQREGPPCTALVDGAAVQVPGLVSKATPLLSSPRPPPPPPPPRPGTVIPSASEVMPTLLVWMPLLLSRFLSWLLKSEEASRSRRAATSDTFSML